MNYDYDIREIYDDILGNDTLHNLCENISDYDLLRLAVEFLRLATQRLDSDLNNNEIYEEYLNLKFIIKSLEEIVKEYV